MVFFNNEVLGMGRAVVNHGKPVKPSGSEFEVQSPQDGLVIARMARHFLFERDLSLAHSQTH